MWKKMVQQFRRMFSGLPGGASGLTRGEAIAFTLPDPDYLIRQLDIVEEATIQGQKGFPAQDARDLDANEGRVKAHLEAAASRSWAVYQERFESLDRDMGALPFRRQWSSPKEIAESFKRQLDTAVQNAENQLRRLFYEMCDAYTALMAFREQHKLMREARLNDNTLSYKLAVFAICFLVEWLFNGYYLGQRLEGGMVAGLTIAASIAAVNIGLGWLIGRLCLPHLLHIKLLNKIFGGLGLTILGAFVIGLNLGVGHMRTVLGVIELTPLDAMHKAFEMLRTQTLNIGDMTSVVLVFVGLLCATGAVWGALRWDEHYPEYAANTRAFRKALNALEQTRRFELNRITRMSESIRTEISDLRASVPAQEGDHQRLKSEMLELQKDFKAHMDGLNGVLNTVLRHYRDFNRSARKAVPEPEYFKKNAELSARTPDDLSRYNSDKALLDKMATAVENEAPNALELVSTEQKNAQERITKILPDHIEPSLACRERAGQQRKAHGEPAEKPKVERGGTDGDA